MSLAPVQPDSPDEPASPSVSSGDRHPSGPLVGGVAGVDFSAHGGQACSVRFVNTTSRFVDLVWLNALGQEVIWRTLSPESTLSIRTFKSHPWIFRDSVSGERLYIKKPTAKANYFECQDFLASLIQSRQYSDQYYDNLSHGVSIICVLIDRSVETLRHLAIKTLRQSLKSKDDCFCLDVPQAIQFELSRLSV